MVIDKLQVYFWRLEMFLSIAMVTPVAHHRGRIIYSLSSDIGRIGPNRP